MRNLCRRIEFQPIFLSGPVVNVATLEVSNDFVLREFLSSQSPWFSGQFETVAFCNGPAAQKTA